MERDAEKPARSLVPPDRRGPRARSAVATVWAAVGRA